MENDELKLEYTHLNAPVGSFHMSNETTQTATLTTTITDRDCTKSYQCPNYFDEYTYTTSASTLPCYDYTLYSIEPNTLHTVLDVNQELNNTIERLQRKLDNVIEILKKLNIKTEILDEL